MRYKNPKLGGGLAELIVQTNYAKYRAEQGESVPQQTTQPDKPMPQRNVEHSGLCAKQFNRNALCDCKSR